MPGEVCGFVIPVEVKIETTISVRNPSGTVTIAGWLNGTNAREAASAAENP